MVVLFAFFVWIVGMRSQLVMLMLCRRIEMEWLMLHVVLVCVHHVCECTDDMTPDGTWAGADLCVCVCVCV